MNPSTRPTEDDLPHLVREAVERAQQARLQMTELSPEEADQVGGALSALRPLQVQPALRLPPGTLAGPLLVQAIQQFQTPVINAAQTQRFGM